jgi:hydroxypyruvate reductase
VTLAISDVVGDDLAVIGSGPAVVDPSTWDDAMRALDHFVSPDDQPASVRALLERGRSGEVPDTLKRDEAALERADAHVIASASDAIAGAAAHAAELGYRVVVLTERVTGEARAAAGRWLRTALAEHAAGTPLCVISAGETTVRVRGGGKGGRNQEFALALTDLLAVHTTPLAVASAGTDGIDGPTDAAGALLDVTTSARAAQHGLSAATYLDDNNSYFFFHTLGDLISTGPTGTNVGDLQVLVAPGA